MIEDAEPLILGSALKREPEIGRKEILHALAFVIAGFEEERGTMFVGPSGTGAMLEIGVAEKYETTVVFHAMPARKKYTDQLGKGW